MSHSKLEVIEPLDYKVTTFEIPVANLFEELTTEEYGCGLFCKLLNKIHKNPFGENPQKNQEISSIMVSIGESQCDRIAWVRQPFSRLHFSIPSVVATAEYKLTQFISRHIPHISNIEAPKVLIDKINIPEILIPTITLERVHLYTYKCNYCGYAWATIHESSICPKCGSPDIEQLVGDNRFSELGWYSTLYSWASKVGDWGTLNWLRNDIMTPIAWINYVAFGKDHIYALLDVIDKYVSEIENKINYAANVVSSHIINPVNEKINELVSDIEDKVNSLANDITNDIISPINDMINDINTVFDHIQSDLYKIWDIPDGYGIAPVHVRNINKSSFEWLSLGPMKVHFIAISRR